MRLDEPKRDSPNGENAKVQHNVRRREFGESGAPFVFRQAKQALLIKKGKTIATVVTRRSRAASFYSRALL